MVLVLLILLNLLVPQKIGKYSSIQEPLNSELEGVNLKIPAQVGESFAYWREEASNSFRSI